MFKRLSLQKWANQNLIRNSFGLNFKSIKMCVLWIIRIGFSHFWSLHEILRCIRNYRQNVGYSRFCTYARCWNCTNRIDPFHSLNLTVWVGSIRKIGRILRVVRPVSIWQYWTTLESERKFWKDNHQKLNVSTCKHAGTYNISCRYIQFFVITDTIDILSILSRQKSLNELNIALSILVMQLTFA